MAVGRVALLSCCAAVAALATAACDGSANGPGPAPLDGSAPDGGSTIVPPAAPALPAATALPMFTPCPTGWREVSTDGVTTCEPWPASGAADCGPGQAHFPGEPGCAPAGAPCPAGDFPEGLPAGRTILHVQASAAAGGDGSLALPFNTIRAAITAAASGNIIALAKGTYDETVTLRGGITLWGACAEETTISTTVASSTAGVITIAGPNVEVHDLRIGPSPRSGIWQETGSVLLEGVSVEGATTFGVTPFSGASLTAHGLIVRGTRADASGSFGRGLDVEDRAHAEVRRVAIEGNRDSGVFVGGIGATVTLEDVVIRDTLARVTDGSGGRAILVRGGGAATVSRGVLQGNRGLAIFVYEPDSALELDHVIVRDTHAAEADGSDAALWVAQPGVTATAQHVVFERQFTQGLRVTEGAIMTLTDAIIRDTGSTTGKGVAGQGIATSDGVILNATRVLVVRNRFVGVDINGVDSMVTFDDLSLHDTMSEESTGDAGRGLNVQGGAVAVVRRATLERNVEAAIFASGDGTVVQLEDITARDTREGATEGGSAAGVAVLANFGASVTVTRALSERSVVGAFASTAAGTMLQLSDVTARDTASRAVDDVGGEGLAAVEGGALMVTRARIEGSQNVGVISTGAGATLIAQDLHVLDARASAVDGTLGRAVSCQLGATVQITRGLLERSREVAISAIGGGVMLEQVRIAGTLERECARTTCVGMGFGIGIGAYLSGSVRATQFEIVGSPLCGVQLASGGMIDLSQGLVSGSEIGACIQIDGYDATRLADGVRYVDNVATIQATTLPVPDATPPSR